MCGLGISVVRCLGFAWFVFRLVVYCCISLFFGFVLIDCDVLWC